MSSGRKNAIAPTGSLTEAVPSPRFSDYTDTKRMAETAHFVVYVDRKLGGRGRDVAESVTSLCQRDFRTIRRFFGGIVPDGLPFHLLLARLPENERAYHYGCAGTDLYCDVITIPAPEPRYTAFLAASLVVEVFMAAQGRSWNCDTAGGKALSHVLAASIYPRQIVGFDTASVWINSDRRSFIDRHDASATDPVAIGCSVLFLNWLHFQLGFGWEEIVGVGGPTLVDCFHRVTGSRSDPFPEFSALMARRFPPGKRVSLASDNPFPTNAMRGESERDRPERQEQGALVAEAEREEIEAITDPEEEPDFPEEGLEMEIPAEGEAPADRPDEEGSGGSGEFETEEIIEIEEGRDENHLKLEGKQRTPDPGKEELQEDDADELAAEWRPHRRATPGTDTVYTLRPPLARPQERESSAGVSRRKSTETTSAAARRSTPPERAATPTPKNAAGKRRAAKHATGKRTPAKNAAGKRTATKPGRPMPRKP